MAAPQVRVPLSKDERKRLKAARRSGLAGSAVLDDFADDVAGVLELGGAASGFTDKLRLGQKFGASLPGDNLGQAGGGAPPMAPLPHAPADCTRSHLYVSHTPALCGEWNLPRLHTSYST